MVEKSSPSTESRHEQVRSRLILHHWNPFQAAGTFAPTYRAALFITLVCGCGSRTITPPPTVPVTGLVTMDGKPVPGVLVKFHPQFNMGKIKYVPLGETDPNGRFTLSTGGPGNGAPPGEYVVTFQKPMIQSDEENSGIEIRVDEWKGRFKDPDKSRWRVTVGKQDSLPTFELN